MNILKNNIKFYQNFKNFTQKNTERFTEKCNAGNTFFSINPLGNVFLCEMEETAVGNILLDGFERCQENLIEARKKYIDIDLGCGNCKYKKVCSYCGPKLKFEYGKPYKNIVACYKVKSLYKRMRILDDSDRESERYF